MVGMIIYASRNGRLIIDKENIYIAAVYISFVIVNYGVISGIALFRWWYRKYI